MNILAEVEATVEIDDVHNAAYVLASLKRCEPEAKVMLLARWMAKSRVFYVNTGREIKSE